MKSLTVTMSREGALALSGSALKAGLLLAVTWGGFTTFVGAAKADPPTPPVPTCRPSNAVCQAKFSEEAIVLVKENFNSAGGLSAGDKIFKNLPADIPFGFDVTAFGTNTGKVPWSDFHVSMKGDLTAYFFRGYSRRLRSNAKVSTKTG